MARFDFDHEAVSRHISCELLYANSIVFEKGYTGHLHAHKCTEAFFVVQGKGEFMVRGRKVPVSAGDFVIVNPNVEHAEASHRAEPLGYIVLGFSGITLLMEQSAQGYCVGSIKSRKNFILYLLSELTKEAEKQERDYAGVCGSMLNILLIYLQRETQWAVQFLPHGARRPAAESSRISWVKQYLDDHFTHDVNLSELAQSIGLNKHHIIRVFHSAYGISPIQYILKKRFDEAKFYLRTSESSIRQIAELCGFHSANYFSQMFQKKFGLSPTQYRQRINLLEGMEEGELLGAGGFQAL